MSDMPLRAKLLAAFLVIALVSVLGVAILFSQTMTAALKENVGASLNQIANSEAFAVGDLLARQIDILRSLSATRALSYQALNVSSGYTGDQQAILERLLAINHQWFAVDDTSPLVQGVLDNIAVSDIQAFQDLFPAFSEIMVTDRYGGLIAATNRVSDFYQADEVWWQTAYNGGLGESIFLSQPVYDESSATMGVDIAVPIYDEYSRDVVGVLKATCRLGRLADLLTSSEVHFPDLRVYVLFADELLLTPDGILLANLDQETMQQLTAMQEESYTELTLFGEPGLVSLAPIAALTGEELIADLGWFIVTYQAREIALAPVAEQRQLMLVMTILIAGVVALAARWFAQFLTRPIQHLTETVRQIRQGNDQIQAVVDTTDEIGQLALAFNEMTGELRRSIDSLEQENAERKQAETAEREQRALATALVDTAEIINSTLVFDEVLWRILSVLKNVVSHDGANIMMLNVSGREAHVLGYCDCYVAHGIEPPNMDMSWPLDQLPHLRQIVDERMSLVIPDTLEYPGWIAERAEMIRSYIGVPIVIDDQTIGVINVDSVVPGFFCEQQAEQLKGFANQAAIAIQNAQLFQRLASYSEDLEQAVEQRTNELSVAYQELQALSKTKDEFVSNVSHELRTPITSLILRQFLLRKQPEELDKHLGVMERDTHRLEHTINDLLRLSRLDQDRTAVTLKPLDLNLLVERVVLDRTLPAEQLGLKLLLEVQNDLPAVLADQGLLEQVLNILLTNAINYTQPNGLVKTRTQTQSVDGQQWAGFCVQDTGPGIKPEEQTRLFERFFRGEVGQQSQAPGTGLGLALAKEIIDRHNGQITVVDEGVIDQGATFTVWLPLAEV